MKNISKTRSKESHSLNKKATDNSRSLLVSEINRSTCMGSSAREISDNLSCYGIKISHETVRKLNKNKLTNVNSSIKRMTRSKIIECLFDVIERKLADGMRWNQISQQLKFAGFDVPERSIRQYFYLAKSKINASRESSISGES